MEDFFEVGSVYLLRGYEHTIHAVVDSLYGKLAFATFPRNNGQDVQTLGIAQFEDSTFLRITVANFETKDSGERTEYDSGMRRDIQSGKPRFDLLLASFLPYEEQLLTRWAALLERGAVKYGEKNWELANSEEELNRFRASAARHFFQWLSGEVDEDHAAAICYNISSYVALKWKLENEDVPSL